MQTSGRKGGAALCPDLGKQQLLDARPLCPGPERGESGGSDRKLPPHHTPRARAAPGWVQGMETGVGRGVCGAPRGTGSWRFVLEPLLQRESQGRGGPGLPASLCPGQIQGRQVGAVMTTADEAS